MSTVNSSRRPSSIPRDSSHLAPSGSGAKLLVGPMISPKPGPTLANAVAAPEALVKKSSPKAISSNVSKKKHRKNTEIGRASGRGGVYELSGETVFNK